MSNSLSDDVARTILSCVDEPVRYDVTSDPAHPHLQVRVTYEAGPLAPGRSLEATTETKLRRLATLLTMEDHETGQFFRAEPVLSEEREDWPLDEDGYVHALIVTRPDMKPVMPAGQEVDY